MTNTSRPVEVTYDHDQGNFVVNIKHIEVSRLSRSFLEEDKRQSIANPHKYAEATLNPLFAAAYKNIDVAALHKKSLEPVDKLNRLLLEGQSGTDELTQESREAHIKFKKTLNQINTGIYPLLPQPVSEPEMVM